MENATYRRQENKENIQTTKHRTSKMRATTDKGYHTNHRNKTHQTNRRQKDKIQETENKRQTDKTQSTSDTTQTTTDEIQTTKNKTRQANNNRQNEHYKRYKTKD